MAAQYISKINIGDSSYNIKDAEARTLIQSLGSPMHMIGKATAEITDGSATDPTIENYTFESAKKGDVVVYNNKEFVWDGEKWCEFGDLGDLGDMAYADTGTASYTPQGSVTTTVSKPAGTVSVTVSDNPEGENLSATVTNGTFKGTETTLKVPAITSSGNANLTVSATIGEAELSYTPAGSVSAPAFTGESSTFTGSAEVTGTASSEFVGTSSTFTGSYTPAGTIDDITPTGTIEFTPETEEFIKTVAAPTVTSTFTGTAASITATTTANLFTASVADETLTLTATDATVTGSVTATGKVTSSATAPSITMGDAVTNATATFTGTKTSLTFKGTADDIEVTGTPSGTVTTTIDEASAEISVTGVPKGSVAAPTFSGTKGYVEGSINGTGTGSIEVISKGTETITYTPTGTISGTTVEAHLPNVTATFEGEDITATSEFSGQAATITVNPAE